MNVLLHICCAPCALFPVNQIRKSGNQVTGFFYNPNIHPFAEYSARREALERYSASSGLEVIFGDYDIENYFRNVIYDEGSPQDRCPACWWLRLQKTAAVALQNGFGSITTTLLGSPYQEHETIKNALAKICEETSLHCYYEDFRVGFRDAHALAHQEGIYCQKYCGCLFSEREWHVRTSQRSKAKSALR